MINKKLHVLMESMLVSMLLVGCSSNSDTKQTASDTPTDVVLDAKTDAYNTIEELEKASDLIVIGTKKEELKSAVERDEAGNFRAAYTISSFQISKVIKNEVNEKNETISILENEAYDKVKNEKLHIGGYENMIEGNAYILYLRKSEDGYYIPRAVTIEKVPHTKSEINKKSLSDLEEVETLHKQIQEKYKDELK